MARGKSKGRGSAESTKPRAAQASGSDSASTTSRGQRPPPQGEGVPQRPYLLGAQSGYQRLNVAMRVLSDPVARTSFSHPYSGQARSWRR